MSSGYRRKAMSLPPLPRVMVPHPHVRIDANTLSGSPHVVGTKVPVRRLWAWHRGGTAVETLMRRYPNLSPGKILDALAFAYDNVDLIQADLEREQKLFEEKGKPDPFARPLSQLALPFAQDDARADRPATARRSRSTPAR
jgi:uncharacterized protein (DUF433 family)